MIEAVALIPTTEESYPFASAERYLKLSEQGYAEREYLVRGTANVYRTVPGTEAEVEVETADAPYVNRIIVRVPKDPARASGNVVVEILNSTAGWEIDRMWILTHRQIVRSGNIYVGITSKHNTKRTLVAFDEERYAPLSWANPTPERPLGFSVDDALARGYLPDIDQQAEPGLFWDMLTDLAWLLRSDSEQNPVAALPHDKIALIGWSQSGSYIFRYLNSFAYRPDVARGGRVFDGYLTGGGVHALIAPVSQYETVSEHAPRLMRVEHAEEPFIEVQTESENGRHGGWRAGLLPDSDRPSFLYRHYDIAGASHDTMYSLVDYYQKDEDLARIGELPRFQGLEAEGNAYPSEVLMAAALRNLFTWIRTGAGPRPCERIAMDDCGENLRDAFGNSRGGLRTCLVDYPTGTFSSDSTMLVGPEGDQHEMVNPLFGSQRAFSGELLRELYGTLDAYRALCEESTAEQVSRGLVCAEDAEYLVEQAVSLARRRGLA